MQPALSVRAAALPAGEAVTVIFLEIATIDDVLEVPCCPWRSKHHIGQGNDDQACHAGIPEDQQRLIYNGHELKNSRTQSEYDLMEGCKLFFKLLLRLTGC